MKRSSNVAPNLFIFFQCINYYFFIGKHFLFFIIRLTQTYCVLSYEAIQTLHFYDSWCTAICAKQRMDKRRFYGIYQVRFTFLWLQTNYQSYGWLAVSYIQSLRWGGVVVGLYFIADVVEASNNTASDSLFLSLRVYFLQL